METAFEMQGRYPGRIIGMDVLRYPQEGPPFPGPDDRAYFHATARRLLVYHAQIETLLLVGRSLWSQESHGIPKQNEEKRRRIWQHYEVTAT